MILGAVDVTNKRINRKETVILRSIKDLISYPIDAVDGKVGKVEDALFDDRYWRLRYVVADTGTWLPGKKVLLSPAHLKALSLIHI